MRIRVHSRYKSIIELRRWCWDVKFTLVPVYPTSAPWGWGDQGLVQDILQPNTLCLHGAARVGHRVIPNKLQIKFLWIFLRKNHIRAHTSAHTVHIFNFFTNNTIMQYGSFWWCTEAPPTGYKVTFVHLPGDKLQDPEGCILIGSPCSNQIRKEIHCLSIIFTQKELWPTMLVGELFSEKEGSSWLCLLMKLCQNL